MVGIGEREVAGCAGIGIEAPYGDVDGENIIVGKVVVFGVTEIDGARVTEIDGAEVAEIDGAEVAEIDGARVTEIDGARVTEIDGAGVAEIDGAEEAEGTQEFIFCVLSAVRPLLAER